MGIARLLSVLPLALALALATLPAAADAGSAYKVDAHWPQLPEGWILGQVAGIAVDANDHVWIVQRPGTLDQSERGAMLDPPRSLCCTPAPPVIEFDAAGNVVRAWGGPEAAPEVDGLNQWPASEHGIFIDHEANVWIGGNGEDDHVVLKFSPEGKFLMRIGRRGRTGGDLSHDFLGRPADIWVDPANGEVYVADGYGNHRVIVFDGAGKFLRLWSADGLAPGDAAAATPYGNPIHCVLGARDGLIYVCDRANNRVQIFRQGVSADQGGAIPELAGEFIVAAGTLGNGSTFDLALSPDQSRLFVADGENQRIWIMDRESVEILGWFGRGGHFPGQFSWVHSIAVDSGGNVYTAEVLHGKRVQKFVPTAQ